MSQIQMEATKMSDATVSYVSLVTRGANRIPFKIIKQEKQDMSATVKKAFAGLDLGSLFNAKKAEQKPVVLGVACMKGDHLETLKTELVAAGFNVETMVEMEDGSVVFQQTDTVIKSDEEVTVIRLNDQVALITKGFSPYNLEYADTDNASFADQCNAQGFYPGVSSVMNVMSDAVRNAVCKAASPSEANAAVAKMFDEAKAYVAKFVSGLPVAAFKMDYAMAATAEVAVKEEAEQATEDAVAKAAKAKAKPAEGSAAEEAGEPADDEAAEKAKAKKTETTEAVAEPAAAPVADVAALVTAEVTKATTALGDQFKSMFGDLTATMKTSLEAVTSGVSALGERVGKTEAAVSGVLVTGSETGEVGGIKKAVKQYEGGREIDTAYAPNVRKQAARH